MSIKQVSSFIYLLIRNEKIIPGFRAEFKLSGPSQSGKFRVSGQPADDGSDHGDFL